MNENVDLFKTFASSSTQSSLSSPTMSSSDLTTSSSSTDFMNSLSSGDIGIISVLRGGVGGDASVGDSMWNVASNSNVSDHAQIASTSDLWIPLLVSYGLDPRLDWKIPQYYSLPYQIIGTLFQAIIFIVGILGNVMVVIVVLRSRGMRTPTNCYLVSLAIADSMVLLASVPNGIIAYYMLGDKWIWGRVGCALFIFFQYLGINASSLSIAAFTVERYIAICHPMLAHKLCTVRRAKRIIMYVWMFATTYCAPWLLLTKVERLYYIGVEEEVLTCKFKLNREHYKGYFLTDMVLFYILPLLVSCVLYALIARILYQTNILTKSSKPAVNTSKFSTSSLINSTNMPVVVNNSNVNLNTMGSSSAIASHQLYSNCQMKKNPSSSDASRVQVVKMLAVVVAVFATLWLPYRGLVVYNSFAYPPYMELWYLMFAKTMIFVNSAINPIIYSACSIKFRREFKRMLTCNHNSSSSSAHNRYRTNGSTVTTGTELYFGETTLRANRSTGRTSHHYLSTGNSKFHHVNPVLNLTDSSNLIVRRESDFVTHSNVGKNNDTTQLETTTNINLIYKNDNSQVTIEDVEKKDIIK